MDDSVWKLLRRVLQRIPASRVQAVLTKWDHLSRRQLQSLNFAQSRQQLWENVIALCQENGMTMKHVTELDLIYRIEYPDQGNWQVYQLCDPKDEVLSSGLIEFRQQFKTHLKELINHVSIKIKKHDDEAVWIRIAWGDNYTKPNHFKPTYVVHYLQTPYVFLSGVSVKHRPLLYEALVLAAQYESIKDIHLSGRCFTSLRDLLMLKQTFPAHHPRPLQDRNPPNSADEDPNIQNEHEKQVEDALQIASEAFGDGPLPRLQTAVYKLETKFKDPENGLLSNRQEPFKGVVKFSSSSLLDSLSYAVTSGIASAPVTPLLSSITRKGRNYFLITDKGPGVSANTPGPKI
uniref:Centromere protein N n=1 Tax=Lepisosteus oculatus TaxID=7918 RepID=W5LX96_LEPOC